MSINYSVWGAPDTWQDAVTNMDGKVGAEGRYCFRDLWLNNYLQLNSIDMPYYWGIGKGSILNQGHYIAPYGNFDSENSAQYVEAEAFEQRDRAFALRGNNMSNYGTAPTQNRYIYRYSPFRTSVIGNVQSAYLDFLFLSFNYQKIVLIPWVDYISRYDVSPGSTTTGQPEYKSVSLKKFIDDRLYVGYVITRITYKYALREAGDRIIPDNNFHIAPTIDYNIDEKNWQYNNEPFYARSGMGIINGSTSFGKDYCELTPQSGYYANVSKNNSVNETNALAFHYCKTDENTTCAIYYYDKTKSFWKIHTSNRYYWCVFPYIDMTADNVNEVRDYILSQFAYIGLLFVYDPDDYNKAPGDTGLYVPVFDANGITTGEYKDGANALTLPNASWNVPVTNYDPTKQTEPDNNDSGDLSNAGNYLNRFGAEGLTIWAFYRQSLGNNGLDVAINAITNLYLTDPEGNTKWQLDFKGSNPDDYIVSLMAFPLRFQVSANSSKFKLGPVEFDTIDVPKYTDNGYFTFGSITVPAYGDFRDYAPYTTAELYIPFCGTCDIDMAFFAGHELIVDMYYDIYTGSCAGAIYRYTELGKTLYKTINGQIGVEIPLSAARMGDYQNTLHALETSQKQNDVRIATSVVGMGITAGATIATGGATLPLLAAGVASSMGIMSSVQKSDDINYQIEHTQPKPTQTTAASTQNNYAVGGTRCMLFIKRAHMDSGYNADVYGKTKGFACLLNNRVGENSGLTVCSNIDTTGIPATADEINAIKQAFSSGVII